MPDAASRILAVAIMLAAGGAVVIAISWPWKAALFPVAIGIPVFCMAAAEVIWGLFKPAARGDVPDFQLSGHVPSRVAIRRTLVAIAWMLGFFAAIVLAGFPVAVPLLVICYVKLPGREGWGLSLGLAAAVWGIFYAIFDRLLHLPFPDGWIQIWLGLA